MLDLNDPKIALIHGALIDVLAKRDASRINDYFTEDATLIINEKKLQGAAAILNRIQWLKNNNDIKSVTVTLHNAFFAGDEGFDYHTSEAVYQNNSKACYKIFGYIKLRDNKICHYEDVTIQLEGEQDMTVVVSSD